VDLYSEAGAGVYHQLASHDHIEVREILRLVRPLDGPVLELAAGSGRLTLPLLALGRPVVALDRSPSMLSLLRPLVAATPYGARCTTVEGDMSDFSLGTEFGAVVLATSSISLLDDDHRQGLYRSVRSHLAPGGRFLVSTVAIDPAAAHGSDEVEMDLEAGTGFHVHEHWSIGGSARTVTIFPAREGDGPVTVCTTTVGVLPADRLQREMEDAGLRVRGVVPVDTLDDRRYTDVLLDVEDARDRAPRSASAPERNA
jgi:SAM-dependent methyltransferase